MQTTSALYQTILADSNHWFETKLIIDGVGTFGEGDLFEITRPWSAFDAVPSIGNAVSSEISVKMMMPSTAIPRMGKMTLYERVCNATQQSEWLMQGVFFIDTRSESNNDSSYKTLTLHGYDAMLKAEQDYPNTNHAWPYLDTSVVAEIATAMGVSVDSRTNSFLTAGNMIDLPVGYTMRETLGHIAALYCGNFVISSDGKLLLVPLFGLDSDEWLTGNYLADEDGNALTFGNEGWYALV